MRGSFGKGMAALALAALTTGGAFADGGKAPARKAARPAAEQSAPSPVGALRVPLDQATSISLPADASGVVIGNPSIAGVSVQSSRLLFVTGRSYGSTNLIVLGPNGRQLVRTRITVVPDEENAVMLIEGANQVRYDCTPQCRRRPDMTDELNEWSRAQKQNSDWAELANRARGGN
jgi:hypothetical protein